MLNKLLFFLLLQLTRKEKQGKHQSCNLAKKVDEFEKYDVMSCLLENEEEELIENFLRLAIEGQKAAASVLDQEVVEIQDSEELNVKKRSSRQGPKKQPEINSFFK